MVSRRAFLKYTGATALTLFAYDRFGIAKALAAIPGGTLDPGGVTKYVTPLLIPPVMPTAGTIKLKGGKNADYYEISMRQITQQILPAGLPTATVWGYGAVKAAKKGALLIHNAPSLTIEAQWTWVTIGTGPVYGPGVDVKAGLVSRPPTPPGGFAQCSVGSTGRRCGR